MQTMTHLFHDLAIQLTDASEKVIRHYFRGDIQVQFKEATSPIVTLADQETEKALREILTAEAPTHGVYGEEYGYPEDHPEHAWVLDPIDGTIAFSVGKPTFATLIAYTKGPEFELGVINQPITKERWIGIKGVGTWLNGKSASPSQKTDLSKTSISTSSPYNFDLDNRKKLEKLKDHVHVLSCGGDSYSYGLVASGYLDIVIECNLHLHDFAAAVPVIEAAGGCITDFEGNRLTRHSSGKTVIMSGNATLHRQVLDLINS